MKTSLFRFCGVLLLAAMLAPVCVHARKNPKNPKNNMRLLYWNIQNGMWSGQGDDTFDVLDRVFRRNDLREIVAVSALIPIFMSVAPGQFAPMFRQIGLFGFYLLI